MLMCVQSVTSRDDLSFLCQTSVMWLDFVVGFFQDLHLTIDDPNLDHEVPLSHDHLCRVSYSSPIS